MKVLITGGAGFLGLTLARQLCAKSHLSLGQDSQQAIDCIVLYDTAVPRIRPEGLDERVSFVAGDISDRDTVGKLVDRDDIVVFHLASIVSAGGEADLDRAIRVNLAGTLNILEAARARAGGARARARACGRRPPGRGRRTPGRTRRPSRGASRAPRGARP